MSKKNNIIYLDKKSDTNQKGNKFGESIFNFPSYIEEALSSDLDREFMKINTYFQDSMLKIRATLDVNLFSTQQTLSEINKDLEKFISVNKIKKNKLKDGSWVHIVPDDLLDEWNEKKEMETDFYDSVPINLEALFILLFSRFEGNLEKLLDIFYKTFPDANTYEEKFTLKDLKEFHTISEVGQYVHDKQIFRIMHESNKNKFAWLKKNINFEFSETDQKIFDSLYATRNCIVHHDSIVTDTFVKPINEVFKLNPGNKKNGLGPEIIRGQEINLTQDLFAVSSNFFIIWGHKMILKFWSKMSKSESVFYLSTNLFFRYILLLHSNISTTRKLFETLLNSEITANHADKIDANLIYCLTIKMDEYDTVEVSKKLNEIDWTALSETYLIIKLGLLNDVEGVIDCMRHIGVNGSVKFIRRKFSLKEILSELFFDGVREDPKFVKTYKEIFGK